MAQVRQGNGSRPDNKNTKKASNNTGSRNTKNKAYVNHAKSRNANSSNTKGRTKKNIERIHSADDGFDESHTYAETKRELIIWITLIISIVLLLCVFHLCGPLNNILGAFLFGMFGLLAYIFPFMLFFSIGIFLINRTNKRVVRKVICSWLLYLVLAALVQMLVNDKVSGVFDCYMLGCRTKFGGGFIGGCISLSLSAVMGKLAASIILIIVCIMLFVFVTGKFIASILVDKSVDKYSEYSAERREMRERQRGEDGTDKAQGKRKRSSYFFPRIYNPDKSKDQPSADGGSDSAVDDYSGNAGTDIDTVSRSDMNAADSGSDNGGSNHTGDNNNDDNSTLDDIPIYEKELISKFGNSSDSDDSAIEKLLVRAYEDVEINDVTEENSDSIDDISISDMYNNMSYGNEMFDDNSSNVSSASNIVQNSDFRQMDGQDAYSGISTENGPGDDLSFHNGLEQDSGAVTLTERNPDNRLSVNSDSKTENVLNTNKGIKSDEELKENGEVNIEMPPEPIPYIFPSLDLLSKPSKKSRRMTEYELKETARKLQECLKSFKVEVTMKEIICGPTVTRYELQPALGTRVKKITELENDIKLYLAAKDLRIEAPIPGKSAVGIEVPNSENVTITIREMLETKEFNEHKSNISFAVGKDIGGRNIVADIQKMPHLLIAGSTGSGKSVCINTIIMSLIYKADPNDVKLIMIDPKVVELSIYNSLPHLCIPVVSDPKKAAAALHWAVVEMDERYRKFAELGVRDLLGFNKKVEGLKENPNLYRRMPQIIIIVDELADLMMVASHEVEDSICRLAQKARACGIHLIIATQRPSVDVITGLIKANIPSRIAFAVSSQVDSRTILDSVGAEKLLGKGDMLFFPQGLSKPVRVQGAFVSDDEVARVTEFIQAQYDSPVYDQSIDNKINEVQYASNQTASASASAAEVDDNGRDEIFAEAGRFVIEKQKASIGVLQRVFKIGFNRGARIMDQLCEAGVVSDEDGKKPRNILMTLEEFERMIEEGR